MIIKCLCDSCQRELANEIAQLSNESGIGSLSIYCRHNNVGANLDIVNGVVVNWVTRPAYSVADWQRLEAARVAMAPDILKLAHSHTVATRNRH